MTALRARLAAEIAAHGPMTLAGFMERCLLDPEHGYYATRDPLGAAGDFTTAPEISQMFGELLGLALAQAWMDQGSPARFVLAEAGPGRGTLMADLLRAARKAPGFREAADIHLIEASAALRERQAAALAGENPSWADRIEDLPDGPVFLVANEFFDALPVRQAVREGGAWRERMVGLRGGALTFGLSDPKPVAGLERRLADTGQGDVVEFSPAAQGAAAEIGRRIAAFGGAAVIVDYGGWGSLGDTFQAVRAHRPADPLAEPGMADLTAHVDFEALARAAPCLATAATPQGAFLERLGIAQRAQALAQSLNGRAAESHAAAHRRLTHPDEMGTLFKAMGLHPEGTPPPPGLDS